MKLGMVGLGRMGANMSERLIRGGHEVVVFDPRSEAVTALAGKGAIGASSLEDLVSKLESPRVVWMMVPAGKAVESVIQELIPLLEKGDRVVDGGNSNYRDTLRQSEILHGHDLHLIDVGTSGGVWGLAEGYSMMVGGSDESIDLLRPALETLAPGAEKGWGHVGPVGSGHFVKMIHNGIEYGMMQAYAEGFAIMKKKEQFEIDLHQVAEIWRFGSVVRSWLLDLTALALEKDATLEDIAPWVADSGEGRWTVAEAVDLDVPAPVITLALLARLRSRDESSFADRLLAAMRNEFGGHAVKKAGDQ